MSEWPQRWVAVSLSIIALAGCDPDDPTITLSDQQAEPGGTVLPLQTARVNIPDAGARVPRDAAAADAALAPPRPFEAYQRIPNDSIADLLATVRVRVGWRYPSQGGAGDLAKPTGQAFEDLLKETLVEWEVDLATIGRMRAQIVTRGQPLPIGTAILARSDRYGHGLVWQSGDRYRLLPPGTIRSAMGDLRADVTPLTAGTIENGKNDKNKGLITRHVRVRSTVSILDLELGRLDEVGRGGPLLCRLLLEVAGVQPNSEICAVGEFPVSASLTWIINGEEQPGIRMEAMNITRALESRAQLLSLPPPRARRVHTGLPGARTQVTLSDKEAESLGAAAARPTEPPRDGAPAVGLVAHNRSDELLVLVVNGVVVGTVAPWTDLSLNTLQSARYLVEWRSYWGNLREVLGPVDVPGVVGFGAPQPENPDAG